METKLDPVIVKIHYHWLIADSVREALKVYSGAPKDLPDNSSEEFEALMTFGKAHSDFNVIKVWYALLYVVIEDYQTEDSLELSSSGGKLVSVANEGVLKIFLQGQLAQ